jgi:lipopolysaccharide biosynthesis regulator YciM
MDQAIEMHKQAQSLDPYFIPYTAWLGGLYLVAEDWDNAIIEAEKAFELNPSDPNALWVLGDAYFALDRTEEALEVYETLATINPEMSWQLGRAYAILGRTDEALAIALELEEDGLSPQEALGLIALWPYLENTNRAIELLEYEDMHTWLPWTRVMGHFEPLREDPRYLEFLKRNLGLPLPGNRSS